MRAFIFCTLLLFAPLVLFPDLLFLAGREVVLDVEGLSDILGGFTLDHVCNRLARHVQKALKWKLKVIRVVG